MVADAEVDADTFGALRVADVDGVTGCVRCVQRARHLLAATWPHMH